LPFHCFENLTVPHVIQSRSSDQNVPFSFHCFENLTVLHVIQSRCSNAVPTTCQQEVFALLVPRLLASCWQLATRLLSSTDLSQVVPITCYRPTIQQVVSDNLVATW
jgi:hypothetical protein